MTNNDIPEIIKSDAEWREQLTPEQYYVTRKEGTEPPSHDDGFPKVAGFFHCVCCDARLFEQRSKYDSGSGWPSFWSPCKDAPLGTKTDLKLLEERTEVHCNRCEAHLGHVFPDGPPPTGLRYCVNSVALKFTATSP